MSKLKIVAIVFGVIGSAFGGKWTYDEFNGRHFDKTGYNRYGFNKEGFDKNGFDKEGYNLSGYDKDGFDRNGFDIEHYGRDGFNVEGYDRNGYDRNGFDINGYNNESFDRDGYNIDGFNKNGFNREGYDANGYDQDGFDASGYNCEGFDNEGYDREGYNINGYDRANQNREYYTNSLKDLMKDISNHKKISLKYRYKMLDYRFVIETLLRMIIEHYKGKKILENKDNDFLCRYIDIVYTEKLIELTEDEKRSIKIAKNYFGDFLHPKNRIISSYKEAKAVGTVKMLYNKVQDKLYLNQAA